MSADRFSGALQDFKSFVGKEKNVACVLLFGSVARGEASGHSDLDVCIVLRGGRKAKISEKILDIEKKRDININVVFTDPKFAGLDKYFIETLLREGVVIAGKMPEVPVQRLMLEPHEIIKYDMTNLARTEKMKLKRILYGMTTQKKYKGKIYESKKKGLVESLKGLRIGIASMLIPEKESLQMEKLLKEFGINYRKITIWLSKP